MGTPSAIYGFNYVSHVLEIDTFYIQVPERTHRLTSVTISEWNKSETTAGLIWAVPWFETSFYVVTQTPRSVRNLTDNREPGTTLSTCLLSRLNTVAFLMNK